MTRKSCENRRRWLSGQREIDSAKFTYWGQKLYGNYDGKGLRVGGKFVPTQSTVPDLLSYAAIEDGHWTIVLINKNRSESVVAAVDLRKGNGRYRTYTLARSLGLRLLEEHGTAQSQLSVTVPPYAAVLVRTEP